MTTFKKFAKVSVVEARPWTEGMSMSGVSISDEDKSRGSPQAGDFIVRDPSTPSDQWLVSGPVWKRNYETWDDPWEETA